MAIYLGERFPLAPRYSFARRLVRLRALPRTCNGAKQRCSSCAGNLLSHAASTLWKCQIPTTRRKYGGLSTPVCTSILFLVLHYRRRSGLPSDMTCITLVFLTFGIAAPDAAPRCGRACRFGDCGTLRTVGICLWRCPLVQHDLGRNGSTVAGQGDCCILTMTPTGRQWIQRTAAILSLAALLLRQQRPLPL